MIYSSSDAIVYYESFQNPEFDHLVGDFHLEPYGGNEHHWATISNIALIDNETIRIIFRGDNPNGNNTLASYGIPNDFEYTGLVKKGQTFIPVCNKDGILTTEMIEKDQTLIPVRIKKSQVAFLQYMGVAQLSGDYYYKFYHTNAALPKELVCKYPQIIQHSFNVNFDIGEYATFPKFFSNGKLINNVDSDMVVSVDRPCEVLECKSLK